MGNYFVPSPSLHNQLFLKHRHMSHTERPLTQCKGPISTDLFFRKLLQHFKFDKEMTLIMRSLDFLTGTHHSEKSFAFLNLLELNDDLCFLFFSHLCFYKHGHLLKRFTPVDRRIFHANGSTQIRVVLKAVWNLINGRSPLLLTTKKE